MEQSANAGYDDLSQQVKDANRAKKKLLTDIFKDIETLMQNICDPDPPGCSGIKRPHGSYEDLCLSIQSANAEKKALLTTISNKIEKLLQKVCDPDPPGC